MNTNINSLHTCTQVQIYERKKKESKPVRMQNWMHGWLTEKNYNHLLKIFFIPPIAIILSM